MHPIANHLSCVIVLTLVGSAGCTGSDVIDSTSATTLPVAADTQTEINALQLEKQKLEAQLENAQLRAELAALRGNAATPTTAAPPASSAGTARPTPTLRDRSTEADPGQRTLNFWNQMNVVIDTEADMRKAPSGGVTHGNAGGFVNARIDAGNFAIESLEGLDTNHVDAEAVALREKLVDWYREGVRVSQMADQLMGSSDALRQGQAGMAWKMQEMKHNADVRKVNQFGARVRKSLQARYGIAFPPLK